MLTTWPSPHSNIEFTTNRSRFGIHPSSIGYKFTVVAKVGGEYVGDGSIIYSKTRIPMFIDYDVLEPYRRQRIASRITRILITSPKIVKDSNKVFVLYDPDAREFWTAQLPLLYTEFKKIIFREYNYCKPPLLLWHELNLDERQPILGPVDDPLYY